jgi:exodeoxyribonuclease VII small subunit
MTNERRRRLTPQNGAQSVPPPQLAAEPLAFEEALGRLDETVTALEGGQLPLEEAIRLYEEGIRLAQRCQQILDHAELQVQQLRVAASGHNAGEDFVLEDFEPGDAE